MGKIRLFIFCLFIAASNQSIGQNASIHGILTDSLDQPVSDANILLFQNDSLVDYTFSNTKGSFRFNSLKKQKYKLQVSALSFQKIEKIIHIEEDLRYDLDLKLSNQYDNLKEVVLEVERAIEIREDTIIFKADAFKRRNDLLLEDLLKNVPGIQVEGDGTVKFQGKPITKVKIENDDLFSSSYKILTKNLNADLIDKIQVLQNYSDNELLKNVQDTEDVALNLTLKEDRTSEFFGDVSLGYAIEGRHDLRGNLISLLNSVKLYSFFNFNNVGHEPIGEISDLINSTSYSDDQTETLGRDISATSFVSLDTRRPLLDNDISNLNNAKFGSTNAIFNPGKNFKIQSLFVFAADEKEFLNSQTTAFLIENPFYLEEYYNISREENFFLSKLYVKWDLKKNTSLNYEGRYAFTDVNGLSNLNLNQMPIREDLSLEGNRTRHKLTLTKKISDSAAVVINGIYIYDNRPQNYQIRPFLYTSLEGKQRESEDYIGTTTFSQNELSYAGLQASYILNRPKHNFLFQAVLSSKRDLFKSYFHLNTNSNDFEETGFSNDLNFQQENYYLKFRYRYRVDNFDIIANLKSAWLIHYIEKNNEKNNSFFYLDPDLQIKYKPSKRHKFEFSAGLHHNSSGLTEIFDNYLQLNYRSFYRGLGESRLYKSYSSFLSYTFGNWTDKYLFSSVLSYNYDEEYFGRQIQINPEYNVLNQVVLEDRQSLGFGLNLDRYFQDLNSNIKLRTNYELLRYNDLLNGSYREIDATTFSFGFEIRSGFQGWFNYTLGSDWNINSFAYLDEQDSNLKNKSFLDLDFNISPKLDFHVVNERYYFRELERNKSYYFTDLNLQYVFKKNKLSARLQANNIFNVETFSTFSLSEVAEVRRNTKIIPRYIILGLNLHF